MKWNVTVVMMMNIVLWVYVLGKRISERKSIILLKVRAMATTKNRTTF
jgi:hypothetical protein